MADHPPKTLFIYLLQFDDTGSLNRIYPNSIWKLENPVDSAKWPLDIPSTPDEWIFLDPLPEGEIGAIRETIIALISPWRATDIETLYEKILGEPDRNHRQNLSMALAEKLRARNHAAIPSIAFMEWSFDHIR